MKPHREPAITNLSRSTLSRLLLLAGVVSIVLVSFWTYGKVLHGGFVLDDDALITESSLIQSPQALSRIWFSTEAPDYWPVSNTLFWLQWHLFGLNASGYHSTNFCLHVFDTLLIWAVLRQLSIPGAFLAALLFAVHPVNVESVAWISQEKNTLSMLFFLLSIFCYLKIDFTAQPADRVFPRKWGSWYALSLLAFTLAMLSKGSVAIEPFVLLLIAWWRQGKIRKTDFLRSIPLFAIGALLTAVNIWFQARGSGHAIRNITFDQRLLGAGAAIWFYLTKAILPIHLIFVYPQWEIDSANLRWWLPLSAAAGVTVWLLWAGLWRKLKWVRPLLLAWAFFCLALVPVLGLVDVGFMKFSLVADHYQYLALIGVLTLVASGWATWHRQAHQPVRWALIGVACAAVATLALLSHEQSLLYLDPILLYRDTIEKNPAACLAYNNLGIALDHAGQSQSAIENYQHAIRIKADYPDPHMNLGVALAKINKPEEALEQYQQALRIKPNYVEAQYDRANLLIKLGRYQEAIDQLETTLHLYPNFPQAENNLGAALTLSNRPQEALGHYQEALRLKPDYVEAYANLSFALAKLNRPAEATAAAQRAVELARSNGQTALVRQIESQLNSRGADNPNLQEHGQP
jgi:tetratricopeptide (TPR) repeat protein